MVSRETFEAERLFDLSELWYREIFQGADNPWSVLAPKIKEAWIRGHLKPTLDGLQRDTSGLVQAKGEVAVEGGVATVESGSYLVGEEIELRAGVHVEGGAWITGPTILGPGTTVRQGAYIRGGVLTGRGAVIGHTTEVKSSLFMNEAKAAHFAYVGDSILGNGVNLGAGTKVSNLKITNDEVVLRVEDRVLHTGLRKMGALIGDGTETGCNSVLNPGVLLGKKCLVYPAVAVRKRYYKDGSVIR